MTKSDIIIELKTQKITMLFDPFFTGNTKADITEKEVFCNMMLLFVERQKKKASKHLSPVSKVVSKLLKLLIPINTLAKL